MTQNTLTYTDKSFSGLLVDIVNGREVGFNELRPFLLVEDLELRVKVNMVLAEAFWQSKKGNYLISAQSFIERAFQLSGFPEDLIDLYVEINQACGNIEAIRAAYKRLGLKYASDNNIEKALNWFNKAQLVFTQQKRIDEYEYDFEMLDTIHRLAESLKFSHADTHADVNSKIKVAYLLKGLKDVNSVLIKTSLLQAEYHDKSMFEIRFFAPETEYEITNNINAQEYVKQFNSFGYDIVPSPNAGSKLDNVLELAKKINEFNPHILTGNAVLADLFDYFVMALNPARLNIGILAGPMPIFASPYMDWNISLFKAMQLDALSNSTYIPLEVDLPETTDSEERVKMGIPDQSIVLASAGRSAKFQNKEYWETIIQSVNTDPNVYYLAIGIEKEWVSFLKELIPDELSPRFLFTGWRKDYLKLLNTADIVLDTYPTGSGVSIMDAMALGKPVVTFSHDYFKMFNQKEASGAEEFILMPELTIERGDFDSFKNKVLTLIKDENYRSAIGEKCRTQIHELSGSPGRMVRRFEKAYVSIIKELLFKNNTNACALLDELISESSVDNIEINYSAVENEIAQELKQYKLSLLEKENYQAWQKAYSEGYNSSMGNHTSYFYNTFLESIGFYDEVTKANKVIEYGPGNGEFIKNFIELFPEKTFYLLDLDEENLKNLQTTLGKYKTAKLYLNFPEIYEFKNIDLAFSFLLCQSMPRTLWNNHLQAVNNMLGSNGSYIFQFASHPEGIATDLVSDGVAGNNKYTPEEMFKFLEEAGFSGADLTVPITLEKLNSDITWYLCKAYK